MKKGIEVKWELSQNIKSLSGKVIVVTGGNSGLGFESVKAFSSCGAQVVLACRDVEKGEDARLKILAEFPRAKIKVMKLDLTDLESVHAFVKEFEEEFKRLNVLLNNAGVMMCPYLKTKDGFELQLGTNHLGHFALTGLLLDYLIKTPKSRIVNVSSLAHKQGVFDFDNLMFEKGSYTPMKAYGRSKLANLLFTYELQRKFEAQGIEVIAAAAHPGVSNTNLGKYIEENWFIKKVLLPIMKVFMIQDADMGALPQIRTCVDLEVSSGDFYGPDGFNQMKGYPIKVDSTKQSHDESDAKRLWEISEKLTGVEFKFK